MQHPNGRSNKRGSLQTAHYIYILLRSLEPELPEENLNGEEGETEEISSANTDEKRGSLSSESQDQETNEPEEVVVKKTVSQ